MFKLVRSLIDVPLPPQSVLASHARGSKTPPIGERLFSSTSYWCMMDTRQSSSSNDGGAALQSVTTHQSEELMQGRREVWIEHGQDMYRLRITASGKLYLTK